ncbi:hypothetical protein Tco_1479191 [Tanacetum coccineum]
MDSQSGDKSSIDDDCEKEQEVVWIPSRGDKSFIDDDCDQEQVVAYTKLEPWLKTDSMSGYYPNVVYQEPGLSQMV